MAQGDVVQVGLGDTVKISVTLALKRSELAKRADSDKFSNVSFFLREDKDKRLVESVPVFDVTNDVVTQDNQVITSDCHFKDPPGQSVFRTGDIWDLFIQYRGPGENTDHGDPIRTHFLGRIGIGVTPPRQ